jgi:hypothetical protein
MLHSMDSPCPRNIPKTHCKSGMNETHSPTTHRLTPHQPSETFLPVLSPTITPHQSNKPPIIIQRARFHTLFHNYRALSLCLLWHSACLLGHCINVTLLYFATQKKQHQCIQQTHTPPHSSKCTKPHSLSDFNATLIQTCYSSSE